MARPSKEPAERSTDVTKMHAARNPLRSKAANLMVITPSTMYLSMSRKSISVNSFLIVCDLIALPPGLRASRGSAKAYDFKRVLFPG
jgi:hypothetical protein